MLIVRKKKKEYFVMKMFLWLLFCCLDSAVMEDVSDPGESGVLVALVEELHLFTDYVLCLRAGLFVEVHHKAG